MTTPLRLQWTDIYKAARGVAHALHEQMAYSNFPNLFLYGVPRGGHCSAMAVMHELITKHNRPTTIVHDPERANVIVDDLIDSGATQQEYAKRFPKTPFAALFNKTKKDDWLVFPWETEEEDGPTDNVRRILQHIGEDPNREGLQETPERVIKAWKEICAGYKDDPKNHMTVFEEDCDEMVMIKDMEFVSTCEHHMLPFHGTAAIAYIPDGKVIGVSKLARVFEVYSRRLQIQERIGKQVVNALNEHLRPKGAACIIEASHMCMVCRGVRKQHSKMITSALSGILKQDARARSELLSFVK